MDQIVQDFLSTNNVGVLAIVQDDGTVHSASLHYAHGTDPVRLYFATEKESYKCRPLVNGKASQASLVIGFSEEEMKTFQASGQVKIVSDSEAWKAYVTKFTARGELEHDEDICLLEFTPHWWRYRDMKSKPITEVSSGA